MTPDRKVHSQLGTRPQTKLRRPPYQRLFRQLCNLNNPARLAVCVLMSALVNGPPVAAVINQLARERGTCPHCEGKRIYRHGFANDLQRYRCRSCGVTFNGLTGTPLARLRLKQRWLAYFDCLRDPACTVHRAALKTGVHPNTSFRWRHRFLAWTKLDRPSVLEGVAESDQRFLLDSEKGNRHLQRAPRRHGGLGRKHSDSNELVNLVVARDRSGSTIDFIAGRGALKASALHRHLLPKLAPDVILMSSDDAAYKSFARKACVRHEVIHRSRGQRMRGTVHLQNMSAYYDRFSKWLAHFNGVATRYLENYLGWQWAIDRQRIDCAERFLRAALGSFTT